MAPVFLIALICCAAGAAPAAQARTLEIARAKPTVAQQIASLKLIDYFPAASGWTNMWTNWNPTQLNADFALIASLHANAVRIVIPANTFGYPVPTSTMTSRLSQTIALAAQHGLRSELTLFDGWSAFSDIAGSERWATSILAPYSGDPRIAYLDLHNELAADTSPVQLAWAEAMVPYVQSMDGGIPVTISTSISSSLAPLQALVTGLAAHPANLYDVHYYGNAELAYSVLSQAKKIVGSTPLFVGETGFATDPSYPWTSGLQTDATSLEAYQDYYLRVVEQAALSLGLAPAAPWILWDFLPGAMNPGSNMPAYEYHFGLFRTNGTAKPAAASISSIFATGAVDQSFNNGFETTGDGLPAIWKLWEPTEATFSVDRTVTHSGSVSARIDDAAGTSEGYPAFYATPVTPVVPGITYSSSVWARGANAQGVSRIVLSWFNASDSFIGQNDSASLPTGNTNWTLLAVQGSPPAGAVAVEIQLQVAHNPGTTWFDDVSFGPASELAMVRAIRRADRWPHHRHRRREPHAHRRHLA